MSDRKRVIFSGYFGFGNVGDEAVLAAALDLLQQLRPGVEVTVLSGDVDHTAHMHGVDAVPRESLSEVWRAMRGADLFVSGGGSLLQDVTSLRSTPYYLLMIILARLAGLAVVFYAQGVGPLENRFLRCLSARVLRGVERVSVRDVRSRELLREIGLRRQVLVTADPVFSLQSGEGPGRKRGNGGEVIIGLSPRPWPRAGDTHRAIIEACRRLLAERPDRRLLIIPMHVPDDLEVARTMAAALLGDTGVDPIPGGRERVQILKGERSPVEHLRVFEGLDVLIGMRLHALIMALRSSCPVVGISYDPKVDALLEEFGQTPAGTAVRTEPDDVVSAVEECLVSDQRSGAMPGKVDQLAQRARREMEEICERFLPG